MMLDVVAMHLGALHPVETLLTVVLAFGPFLVLALVILVRRREDDRAAAAAELAEAEGGRVGSSEDDPQRAR